MCSFMIIIADTAAPLVALCYGIDEEDVNRFTIQVWLTLVACSPCLSSRYGRHWWPALPVSQVGMVDTGGLLSLYFMCRLP